MFRFISLSLLFSLLPAVAFADGYPPSQMLLQTDRTVAGEPLHFPAEGAKVSSLIVTLAPGSSTGWHRHGAPMFAYLLSGEVEVEYADGVRRTFRAGDAFMEAMAVAHIGANPGSDPTRILVVFMEGDGTHKTDMAEAPAAPSAALAAGRSPDLVDLAAFAPAIQRDIRYATANNFMGKPLYPAARALLQRPAAEALLRAQKRLNAAGYGLLVLDAYRPWQVTRAMWDKFPKDRPYLADPLSGSRHNRGAAVDVTLIDLKSGSEAPMPSGYDDFSERAHPDYTGGTAAQREARDRLRSAMEAEGFAVHSNEWWHFDFRDWQSWPVLNEPLTAGK